MNETSLFVAQTVGVVDERWYEGRYDDTPLIRSEKSYVLHQNLFTAVDAESAYQKIKQEIEGDTDCNHDGEGDKTWFYNLGIHEIERLDYPLERLVERVQNEDYTFSLGSFNTANVDANGIPLIREKNELAIFRGRT